MRKLLAILGMVTCMVGLSACGQEETSVGPITEEQAVEYGATTVQQIDMIVSQGAIEQYADQDVVYAGLSGWQDALDEIGVFEGTDGGSVQFNDDEVIITVNVKGSEHDAEVEIILDSALSSYVSISTNISYSFGELMKNAALNTLIGLGTVFVVLILISLIISCFGLISKFQEKQQKKSEANAAGNADGAAQADPVVTQIAAREELADDTELVAGIAAAVAAYEGAGSTDGFVVRSIRKSNKSKWQNA